MSVQVELLSQPMNFAVVQLPERTFPGVVVQGDTLNSLVQRIDEMARLLSVGELDDLAAGLEDVREELLGAKMHYEQVCKARGIALPYRG
jgi:hypothetical protein